MSQTNSGSHDVLRDEILADAQRQATRLIRKAERDAQAIVDKAVVESQQERDTKLAAAQTAAERQRVLTLATVPVEIGRLRAIRIEQELSVLRDRVRQELSARRGYRYETALTALATEAVARMEGDEFVLELSRDDLRDFGATLADAVSKQLGRAEVSIRISEVPADMTDGVVVRDRESRQMWDNRLEVRLQRMWPLFRSRIARQLGLPSNVEPSGDPS